MWYDYYYSYYILVVPAILITLWAQVRMNSTFKRYSGVYSRLGKTGRDIAESILRQNGIYDVNVEHISGNLTDHYDPKNKKIRLSDAIYGSNSVAALGVAAHEAGHAVQHATGYSFLKLRNAIIPITNIGSNLALPLVILGMFINMYELVDLGIILFSFAVLFQVITLPVEFNASKRAIEALSSSYTMDEEELRGTKKVLTAAALTYVAALAVSLANLFRLLLVANSGRRRR